MKKIAMMVGLAAALGFSNAEAVDLTWKGDLRYRYQSDLRHTDGATGEHSRDRHRSRVRLGVYPWINEELSGGVQLSTGSLTETTSRNETIDDQFLADPVYLNEYYIDYHPMAYGMNGAANIILGKRAVASDLVVVNDLVWDSDLTFEGLTLQYGKESDGKEKDGLTAVVGYFPLNERSSRTAVAEKDAYILAGQAAYKGEISEVNYLLGAGYYNYANFDVVNTTTYSPAYDYSKKDFNIAELFGTVGGQITEKLPWKITGQYARNMAKKADASGIDDTKRDSYLAEIKIGDAKQVGQWSVNADYIRIERDALTILTDSDRNAGAATNLHGYKIGGVFHLVQNLTVGANYFNFKTIDVANITNHLLMADVVVKF
ncbi:hypothetical protein G9409_11890 [Chlorobium sp. BLA1]|uniref:putative porin n=1 Tax=Candidatus Chlorobium masyuteum TaxID=2716876 RepID=UPI001421BB08|nr:putative porin [Candidatus Chlorobium masyuteum]NHQ61269.1 hypothetical protein [Candidatus Chlorobium masyuteum]